MHTSGNIHRDYMVACLRMIQLSDSALPIGAFSFSAALEAAVAEGVVTDADTLRRYVDAVLTQAVHTEAIAAMVAFRAAQRADYATVLHADCTMLMFRFGSEGRQMLCRMGRRMAELGVMLTGSVLLERWLGDIKRGAAPGTHPVALALMASAVGMSQKMLFASLLYGVAGMVLNAALRCVKVSHYDTQRILFGLADTVTAAYREVSECTLGDMSSFSPELDIISSLHETGTARMFMS